MKKVAIVFVSVLACLYLLAACDDSSPAGEYKLVELTMGDYPVRLDTINIFNVDPDTLKLVLSNNGTFTMSVIDGDSISEDSGRWELNGDRIRLDNSVEILDARVEGHKIIVEWEDDGIPIRIVFEK